MEYFFLLFVLFKKWKCVGIIEVFLLNIEGWWGIFDSVGVGGFFIDFLKIFCGFNVRKL